MVWRAPLVAVCAVAAVAIASIGLSERAVAGRRPAALLEEAPTSVFAALQAYNGNGHGRETRMARTTTPSGGTPYLFSDMQDMHKGQNGMGSLDVDGPGVQDDVLLARLRRLREEKKLLVGKKVAPAPRCPPPRIC